MRIQGRKGVDDKTSMKNRNVKMKKRTDNKQGGDGNGNVEKLKNNRTRKLISLKIIKM